jgi:L-amino acid N-acyltransferase YncA
VISTNASSNSSASAAAVTGNPVNVTIAAMLASDWADVARIYEEGIATGHATFTDAPPRDWAEWNAHHISECSVVARTSAGVVGWACLSPVSSRCVYRGVAEISTYVSSHTRGQGVGGKLVSALIELSERNDIWSLQAGIFPENTRSLRLHLACGFREVGRREKMGRMNFGPMAGIWRDVVLLERRSQVTGV